MNLKKNKPHLSKKGEIINSNLNNKINTGASRILLYGKPGNGKTTIGEVFAKVFDAKLIFLDSASVFAKYSGETEDNIQEYFNQAKKSIMQGIKVVLLIDEIDAIAYSQDKVNSEGSPKVAAKLQTCIDKINKLPNANLLIIIATTNSKNALSRSLESKFSSKVEIVKPKDQDIANKITNIFKGKNIKIDEKNLLNAVKLSKNFRDCIFCAEEISEISLLCTVNDPKKLAKDYKDCISSLQTTYRERTLELLNQTSDNCNKINPILLSISHILGFFRGKKSKISTAENNIDNSSNESKNN